MSKKIAFKSINFFGDEDFDPNIDITKYFVDELSTISKRNSKSREKAGKEETKSRRCLAGTAKKKRQFLTTTLTSPCLPESLPVIRKKWEWPLEKNSVTL